VGKAFRAGSASGARHYASTLNELRSGTPEIDWGTIGQVRENAVTRYYDLLQEGQESMKMPQGKYVQNTGAEDLYSAVYAPLKDAKIAAMEKFAETKDKTAYQQELQRLEMEQTMLYDQSGLAGTLGKNKDEKDKYLAEQAKLNAPVWYSQFTEFEKDQKYTNAVSEVKAGKMDYKDLTYDTNADEFINYYDVLYKQSENMEWDESSGYGENGKWAYNSSTATRDEDRIREFSTRALDSPEAQNGLRKQTKAKLWYARENGDYTPLLESLKYSGLSLKEVVELSKTEEGMNSLENSLFDGERKRITEQLIYDKKFKRNKSHGTLTDAGQAGISARIRAEMADAEREVDLTVNYDESTGKVKGVLKDGTSSWIEKAAGTFVDMTLGKLFPDIADRSKASMGIHNEGVEILTKQSFDKEITRLKNSTNPEDKAKLTKLQENYNKIKPADGEDISLQAAQQRRQKYLSKLQDPSLVDRKERARLTAAVEAEDKTINYWRDKGGREAGDLSTLGTADLALIQLEGADLKSLSKTDAESLKNFKQYIQNNAEMFNTDGFKDLNVQDLATIYEKSNSDFKMQASFRLLDAKEQQDRTAAMFGAVMVDSDGKKTRGNGWANYSILDRKTGKAVPMQELYPPSADGKYGDLFTTVGTNETLPVRQADGTYKMGLLDKVTHNETGETLYVIRELVPMQGYNTAEKKEYMTSMYSNDPKQDRFYKNAKVTVTENDLKDDKARTAKVNAAFSKAPVIELNGREFQTIKIQRPTYNTKNEVVGIATEVLYKDKAGNIFSESSDKNSYFTRPEYTAGIGNMIKIESRQFVKGLTNEFGMPYLNDQGQKETKPGQNTDLSSAILGSTGMQYNTSNQTGNGNTNGGTITDEDE